MHYAHRRDFRHARLEIVIKAAQAEPDDDTPAMGEIIARFEALGYKLVAQITDDLYLRDDLMNTARLATVQAVRKHHLGRPGFPSFVKKYMRGAIIREMKEIAPLEVENIEDHSDIPQPVDVIEKIEDKLAPFGDGTVAATVIELRPAQRRLVALRYVDDLTMAEIAAQTGTSVPAVSQRFSTIHKAIERALAA